MNHITHKPHQYKAIAIWGRILGSFSPYIKEQQILAAKEGAPLTAIYKSFNTGEWRTVEDVSSEATRNTLINGLALIAAHK